DIGANLGLYARHLVSTLKAGRVVSFEPVAENRELLTANLALGGIADRVILMPIALADEDGTAEFQVDDMQSASGTLSKVTGGEACVGRQNLGLGSLTAQVTCRSLDGLLADPQISLPLPDILKIDVEGAEALLLRGAGRLFRERGPRLLIELHGAAVAREVLSLLADAGYSCVAKVSERIDSSGFAAVGPATVPRIEGPYDVRFIAAARDPRDLPAARDLV
ncbi:MAG TPA: FkbM family methyltransferase, partial [Thermoanaerobaculia bacterium]